MRELLIGSAGSAAGRRVRLKATVPFSIAPGLASGVEAGRLVAVGASAEGRLRNRAAGRPRLCGAGKRCAGPTDVHTALSR